MKNDSTKIICEVALRAYRQSEDARELNDERSRLDWLFVHEKLMQVLRAEQPATTTKFDIWRCVSPKSEMNTRPQMCGIWHEDGYEVASDQHILVWRKAEYPETYEHRIAYKDGSFAEEHLRYPKWRMVIPEKNNLTVKIDIARFREAYKEWSSKMKAYRKGATGDNPGIGVVKAGESFFKMDYFKLAVDFMEAYGIDEVKLNEAPNRASLISNEEQGCGFLMMPMQKPDNAEFTPDVEFA